MWSRSEASHLPNVAEIGIVIDMTEKRMSVPTPKTPLPSTEEVTENRQVTAVLQEVVTFGVNLDSLIENYEDLPASQMLDSISGETSELIAVLRSIRDRDLPGKRFETTAKLPESIASQPLIHQLEAVRTELVRIESIVKQLAGRLLEPGYTDLITMLSRIRDAVGQAQADILDSDKMVGEKNEEYQAEVVAYLRQCVTMLERELQTHQHITEKEPLEATQKAVLTLFTDILTDSMTTPTDQEKPTAPRKLYVATYDRYGETHGESEAIPSSRIATILRNALPNPPFGSSFRVIEHSALDNKDFIGPSSPFMLELSLSGTDAWSKGKRHLLGVA